MLLICKYLPCETTVDPDLGYGPGRNDFPPTERFAPIGVRL